MKSVALRKTLLLFPFLFIILTTNSTSIAQDEDVATPDPDVTLYVTEGNLTLYVASPEPILLDGFEFSVVTANDDIFFSRLEARFNLRLFFGEERLIPSGTCFIYQYEEDAPFPEVCNDNRTLTVDVNAGDRFWYTRSGERRDIAITRNETSTQQFCAAWREECALYYSVDEPIPDVGEEPINGVGLDLTDIEQPDARNRFYYRTQESSRGIINEIAWSPDDLYLVSAHANGDICVWSLVETDEFEPIACQDNIHTNGAVAIDWNNDPEQPRFASTGADGVVRLWQVDTGTQEIITEEQVLEAHQSGAVDVHWSPDSSQIISAGTSRLILWDVESGRNESSISSNQPVVADWRSDGRYLITIDNIGVLRVVDSLREEAGVIIDNYPTPVAGVDAVWNPTFGNLASVDDTGTVRIYDYAPGTICDGSLCESTRVSQNLDGASQVRFSPEGDLVAISARNAVHILQAQPPYQLIDRYTFPGENIDVNLTSFDWKPDGAEIVAADDQGNIYFWQVAQTVPPRLFSVHQWQASQVNDNGTDELSDAARILGFDWNQNGRQIALVDENRNLSVWDASTRTRRGASQSHPRLPLAIDWNQRRGLIATGGCGPMALIWRNQATVQFTLNDELDDVYCVSSLSFDPAGDLLAIANQGGVIRFWDWREQVQLSEQQLAFEISDLEWDASGTRLASVNENGLLSVFNVVNNRVSQNFVREPHAGIALNALVWSPDGQRIVTGSATGEVVIWNLDSGEFGTMQGGFVLRGHTRPVVGVSWTVINNRSFVVSVSDDGRVIVWDAESGERLAQISMETTPVEVKWSPYAEDGVFAIADTSGFISLWRFVY